MSRSSVSLARCEKFDRRVLSRPLSHLSSVNLLSQAVHSYSYCHGIIKPMESFCSLQVALQQVAKASALRLEVKSLLLLSRAAVAGCSENPH